jgi:CheY-like chemotaxis protein
VKKATLLLADDSVTIQRVIELTFANEDIRVVAVSDGAQAVRWIDLERPDIVLADVSMPQVDGYGVSSHVKQSASLRSIPVLLLTGAFEPVDEEKAKASGCDGVLVKPFEPKQLVSRVKELLRREAAAPATAEAAPAPQPPAVPPTADLELEEIDAALEAATPAPAISHSPFEPEEPILIPEAELQEVSSKPLETPDPEPLEPPKERVWDLAVARRQPQKSGPPAVVSNKLSLANAFSALLSAEQAQPAQQSLAPVVTESMVEDVVRKVLTRLTGDMVRSVVLEATERIVREEIEKIKGSE